MVRDELASPGKMLWWCDHESTAAIHLGIGHITIQASRSLAELVLLVTEDHPFVQSHAVRMAGAYTVPVVDSGAVEHCLLSHHSALRAMQSWRASIHAGLARYQYSHCQPPFNTSCGTISSKNIQVIHMMLDQLRLACLLDSIWWSLNACSGESS